MRHLLSLLLAFSVIGGNALKRPLTGPESTLMVAQDGVPAMTILTPEQPAPEEEIAIRELQTALKRITGADFPVAKAVEPGRKYIGIGRTVNAPTTPETGSDEGFGITVADGNIAILGDTPKGTLNGVYAFLEEDLNCRWYGDGGEYYPSIPTLEVRIASRKDAPAFVRRNPFTYLSYDRDFCRRNRIMPDDGFGYIPGWFCHTYDNIVPSTSFEENKELFMIGADGKPDQHQLCPTHPEVMRRAVEKVRQAIQANHDPGRRLISIAQNDYHYFCQCERCRKIIAEHGGAVMAPHLLLVNHVARAIASEFPDIEIVFIAYHHTRQPPAGMSVEPNAHPWFCITADKNLSFITVADTPGMRTDLEQWCRLSNRVEIWDYMVDFQNYFMPFPSFDSIAANLRIYQELGCSGVMLQGQRESLGGDRVGMRAWIMAKLLWDPSRDWRELMKDYNFGVYGPGGAAMQDYCDLVEEAGLHRRRVAEYYGIEEFLDRAEDCFKRARQEIESSGATEKLPALELAELPVTSLRLDWLGRNGKEQLADREYYRERLAFFERVAAANGVRVSKEGTPIEKYIADKRLLVSEGDTIRSGPSEWTCWPSIGAVEQSDPVVPGVTAVAQECNNTWSIQWELPTGALKPGVKYSGRALLRIDQDTGRDVWMFGIHDKDGGTNILTRNISGTRLNSGEYRWIEFGEAFTPPASGYFWGAGIKAENDPRKIWVQAIEFTPVP